MSIFLGSLDESEVRRAARGDRPRAELCVKMDSGHFKSKLNGGVLRSKYILTAWPYEAIDTFVMLEN